MPRTVTTIWRNALLAALSLLVAVAGLEGLARLLVPADDVAGRGLDLQHFSADRAAEPDPLLGYRLRRNAEVANFRFNNLGFVGPDMAAQKPAGTFRILCLGGSTTLGAGAEADRFSYPALLGEIFRRLGRNPDVRVEVVNGGVFGYHSWHTRLRTQKELPALSPDYYVLMDGLNDVMAACRQMAPADLDRLADSMDAVLRTLVAGRANGVAAWLERRLSGLALTRLARELGRKLRPAPSAAGQDCAARLEKFRFRGNLDAILAQAKADGIAALVVNYPWLPAREPAVTASMGLSDDDVRLYGIGRQAVAAVNTDVTRQDGVPLVDPQPLFDQAVAATGKPRLYFSDTVHFTRLGNFALAKAVYAALAADPAVARATGRPTPATDAEIDALFPDILAWRPADGSGWPTARETALETAAPEETGLAIKGPDGEGTASLAPAGEEAVIRLRLSGTPPKEAFFYPRISGDGKSAVHVLAVSPDGAKREIFALRNDTGDGIWSPVAGRYELSLPKRPDLVLEIVLSGHDAQVWSRGGKLLFAAAPEAGRAAN